MDDKLLILKIVLVHQELEVDDLWMLASMLDISLINHGSKTVTLIVTLFDFHLKDERQAKVVDATLFCNFIEDVE